ncbi:MAG: peptidoglycan DD-metalloendopeptidase family protein [Firmicutes bacterium]|nr:peptidoglycan DD-metalloendopeptidase family protein [Candidatus Fermentithermobacillaceae bacterium]
MRLQKGKTGTLKNGAGFVRPACFLLMAALLVVTLATPVRRCRATGDVLDEKLRQLDELQREIEQYKKDIESKKKTERSLAAEIARLEREIELTNKEIAYIEVRTEYLNARLDKTRKEIAATEAKLQTQQKLFEDRLVAMYKVGSVSYVELLLSAKSLTDLMTRARYLKEIARQDASIIEEYKKTKDQLNALKQSLEGDIRELANLRIDRERKVHQVASRAKERETYLAQIQSDRKKLEEALDELERESQLLAEEIERLQAQSSRPGKANLSMIWPVQGTITSYFGNRIHPILGDARFHAGIDIAAGYGTPIRAAEDGRVLVARYEGGYGNYVVLDHGGGISTVYAHCQSLLVKVGQEVTRGQVIAKVGSTGLSTGPHLHFEVRVQGQPTNPLNYLP